MDSGEQKIVFSVAKIFLVAFGFLGLLLNATEMRLLIHKGKKKSCYEILLLGLGCADILAASIFLMHGVLIILSTDLVGDVAKGKIKMMMGITGGAIGISIGLSNMNVYLITIDRYITVNFPLKHRIWVTKRRTKILLVVGWCLQPIPMCLYFFVPTVNRRLIIKALGAMNMSGCVALLFVYGCIARKLRNVQRQRKRWNTERMDSDRNSNSEQDRLVIANSIAVTLCFIICYAPSGFFTLSIETTDYTGYFATVPFLALNPVIDPMIYFLFSYYLRRAQMKNKLSAQHGGGLGLETVDAKYSCHSL